MLLKDEHRRKTTPKNPYPLARRNHQRHRIDGGGRDLHEGRAENRSYRQPLGVNSLRHQLERLQREAQLLAEKQIGRLQQVGGL